QDPVAAVIDQQQLGGESMLPGAEQLRQSVEETAIADHRESGCVRQSRPGPKSRRPGITQRARAKWVEEPPRLERWEVGGRRVAEDGHVPGTDSIARKDRSDRPQQPAF